MTYKSRGRAAELLSTLKQVPEDFTDADDVKTRRAHGVGNADELFLRGRIDDRLDRAL